MTMQVSTSSLFSIPRNAVVELQSQIAKAETEVSTGQLADPAQSLGSQLGLYQTLQAQSANLGNIQSSNTIVQSTLSASQNALTQIASDAQTFVNAIMTAQSSGSVGTLPAQAQSLLASLTSFLNSTSGGAYVFGGTNSTVKPVADYSQGAQAATAAAFQTAFGMSQSDPQVSTISAASMQTFLTGAFANLFQGADWSANWSQASSTRTSALISPANVVTMSVTANESAFQDLANAYTSIADLAIGNLGATTQQAVLSSALSLAGAAQQAITGLQTTLGISQSQITNANSQMQTQASLIDNWVSKLGAVDPYQAASTLTNLTTQLETAYSLTDRISKLSLVNYLT
jgi:flagellar hook-associated protein 3 FlgL